MYLDMLLLASTLLILSFVYPAFNHGPIFIEKFPSLSQKPPLYLRGRLLTFNSS